MSFNSIKTKMQSERGFTIVELLIVIVVIGILAAITIVAYNGVTQRSNTTAAKQAANAFSKKAELYNAEKNNYPDTAAALTGAASTTSYFLSGVTVSYSAVAVTAAPATNSSIRVLKCAAGNPANQAAINSTNITGLQIGWWDYQAAAEIAPGSATALAVGANTGSTTTCPTS